MCVCIYWRPLQQIIVFWPKAFIIENNNWNLQSFYPEERERESTICYHKKTILNDNFFASMSATGLYGVAKIKNSTLNIEYLWEKKIHFMQKIVNHSFRYMSLSSFRSKKVKKWIENKILTDKKNSREYWWKT